MALLELRLLKFAVAGFALAGLLYLLGLFLRPRAVRSAGTIALFLSWSVYTLSFVIRVAQHLRLPLQSSYDQLLWFIWWLVLVYLVVEDRTRVTLPGLLVAGAAYGLGHGLLLRMDSSVLPTLPQQNTFWFAAHAATLYPAFACLAVAVTIELSAFWFGRLIRREMRAPAERFESYLEFRSYAYRLVLLAFPFLSFALLSSAIGRSLVRGHYWAWSRQETWTLVAWVLYASYLHLRTQLRTSRGVATAFSVLGAAALTLSFTGITWLIRLLRLRGS